MTVVPETTPVAMPVVLPMVAITALLLHVPPLTASERVLVVPSQIASTPVIAAGDGFTVTSSVAVLPPGAVYVIVAVPGAAPVTIPLEEPTVATPVVLLDQVPPAGVSDRVVEYPEQMAATPVIVPA